MNKYKIVIACDCEEGEEFADWLRQQGHEASVGNDTGNPMVYGRPLITNIPR